MATQHEIGGSYQVPIGALPPYDAWNRALAEHFFGPRRRARPVYLQVDSDTLQEIAPALGVAPDSAEKAFIQAVRRVVYVASPNPFWRIEKMARSWRRSPNRRSEPPPFVALLGLCVLAASHMHRDEERGIASNNYYAWLNELLGRDAWGQPPGFDIVTGYWNELRRWLNAENQGGLGICTSAPIGRFRFIGYPISQCLLREADRAKLPDFFDFAQIPPRAEVDPQDIIGPLARWCQQATCGLSARAKQLALRGSQEVRQQITEIVAEEARLWGGEVQDTTGRRIAPLVLWVEPAKGGHEFDIQFFPRRPEGFPGGMFRSPQGTYELVPLEGTAWYEPCPLDAQRVLDEGIELRQGRFTLRWIPASVVVAKRDLELGGYTSQPQASLNEPLLVLCRSYLQLPLEQFLERYAAPGWRRASGTAGLPPGWQVYLGVAIQRRPPWARPEFGCLVPEQRLSIRLEGGLKLDSSTWLAGAEPIVRISMGVPGSFQVEVDGTLALESADGVAELDLSALGLRPGEHAVTASGRTRRFETCRSGDYHSLVATNGPRQYLGHVLWRRGNRFEASYPSPRLVEGAAMAPGELRVVGVAIKAHRDDLPENLPGPVVLPGGSRRYILLGPQPGMVYECQDPGMPPFACFRRWVMPMPFEVTPPFQPIWLVRISWSRHFSLSLIGRLSPPARQPWAQGDLTQWVRWLRKKYRRAPKGEAAHLWQEYAKVAKGL